ncbi:MAG: ATP-binding protein [Chloroflexi bacterium]|nr:ATP-binding protein [Chloroflexota bacterium]
MERLGDMLKKSPTTSSKGNEGISPSAEPVEAPAEACPFCHGAGFFRSGAPAGDPDFARLIPCSCTVSRLEAGRLARLERYSNLGPLSRFTFDNLVPRGRRSDAASQERFQKIVETSRKFAEQPEGWLVLLGPHGCGKTHLAAAIANYRLGRGKPALFILVPELLDHLRSTYRPDSEVSYDELFQQVKSSPLLVLDDLGSQATTPWAAEKLYQIVNSRFLERLPTVFTSSTPLEGLDERLRTRLEDAELSRVLLLEEKAPPSPEAESGLELLQHMTFEKFDVKRVDLSTEQRENLQEAFRAADNFAKKPSGWLVLGGETGCGKTHLAAAIGNYRVAQGLPVVFVSVPDFLDHLRATFNPQSPVSYDELFEKVKTAPLLILDDFGEQTSTPWAQAKLDQLINYRYNARLATVFTTSRNTEEMNARGERRMTSRLGDVELSRVISIMASDYRAGGLGRRPGERPPPRQTAYRRK